MRGRVTWIAVVAAATTVAGAMLMRSAGAGVVERARVPLPDGEAIVLAEGRGGARVLERILPGSRRGVENEARWSLEVGDVPGDRLVRAGDLVLLPVRDAHGTVATAAYATSTGERRFLAAHPPGAEGFRPEGYGARRVGAAHLIEVLPYATPELRALAPDTGEERWRVPLPGGAPSRGPERDAGGDGAGPVELRVVDGALQIDGRDGRTVFRVALADGRVERLGGPEASAVCPLEGAVVALDRAGFLSVAPLEGGVPIRLGRPGLGALPACASVGRRLYVVFRADTSLQASPVDDGRAIDDPFLPIGSGSGFLAFDAGRYAFGRAFAWGDVVAPFTRPDTPAAPSPSEVIEIEVRAREARSDAPPRGDESSAASRAYRVELAAGRFERTPVAPERAED